MTVEPLVDPQTLFGDDGERPACHYQSVTTLRELLGGGAADTIEGVEVSGREAADTKREALEDEIACSQAKYKWGSVLRGDQRI